MIKRILVCLLALSCMLAGCRKMDPAVGKPDDENKEENVDPAPGNPYEEPVPELIAFTNARLEYKGDDGYTQLSDEWALLLYTDGYPEGPAKVMRLDFNAAYKPEQVPDLACILGSYRDQASTGDYSVGTFNWGQMFRQDYPGGQLEMPDMSFFGDIPAGEYEFEADLLREGNFTISANADGTYSVEGILVGTQYRKRCFSYTGPLDPESYVEPTPPNSTLKGDLSLSDTFTQARVYDRGNRFFLPDLDENADPSMPHATSYRYFEFCLAEEGIDLDVLVPVGNGKILQLDLLVPYETDPADGIPAGVYTVSHRIGTGVDREDIVPFRFMEGQPDLFTRPAGSWFRTMAGESWGDTYARITDGTVTVERSGAQHRITVDLSDCSDPAYRITGQFACNVAVFQ